MRAYLGAWNDHDAERIAAFFTDDAVYADHGAGATAVGRENLWAHAAVSTPPVSTPVFRISASSSSAPPMARTSRPTSGARR